MGVSAFWQAPGDNHLHDKGSVKMHKAAGKILAALNDNFSINFTDSHTIDKVTLHNTRHSTATLCVGLFVFRICIRQQKDYKHNWGGDKLFPSKL